MTDVLIFGSAIVDFICYVDRLPKAGETLHGNKFATGFGGKGANQCVSAARLGARTALIAKMGDDSWGNDYVEHLRKEGVNVDFVEKVKGQSTGIAQISVSADGENNIIIVVGANNTLSIEGVTKAADYFNNSKVLLCQLETPLDSTLMALRNFKGISILNAAPALANTPKELVQAATIFCVNETEAGLMLGMDVTFENSKEALLKLLAFGANTVLITLGSAGAVYVRRDEPSQCVHVAAPKVAKVVDTTGAGDAFLGALAFYLSLHPELPLYEQVAQACNVAAYSVQYPGTQSSFPTLKQLSDRPEQETQWRVM